MAQTGEGTSKTEEEARQCVEADTCAVTDQGHVDCGEETTDLRWSMNEELLTKSPARREVELVPIPRARLPPLGRPAQGP